MKIYLVAVAAGLLVGVIYALLGVRSPAPPLVALCGLLGILVGEQIVPTAQRVLRAQPITRAWLTKECVPRITGVAPESPADDKANGVGGSLPDR